MSKWTWLGVTALIVGLGANGLLRADDTNNLTGSAAPEISLPTVNGANVKLSDQRGKVVLLDFWATWCPPCRASLPHIQKMSDDASRAGKGLVVWAVNAQEDRDDVASFLKDNHYTFTTALDASGDSMRDLMIRGIPTTIVVGRDGRIQNVFVGVSADTEQQIDAAVDQALDRPAK